MGLLEIILILVAVFMYFNGGIQSVLMVSPVLLIIWIFVTKRPSVLMYFANKAYHEGKTQVALNHYQKLSKLSRATPYMVLSYAYILLKDGQIEEARKVARRVENQKPTGDSNRLYLHAIFALIKWKEGDLDRAISILEKAHEKGLKNSTTYGTLGNFYNLRGDLEAALAFNLDAKEYNDQNTVILDNLVECYLLRKELDKATEEAQVLMAKNPNFPEAYVHYAEILLSEGNREEARKALETACEKPFSSLSNISRKQIEEMLHPLNEERGLTE